MLRDFQVVSQQRVIEPIWSQSCLNSIHHALVIFFYRCVKIFENCYKTVILDQSKAAEKNCECWCNDLKGLRLGLNGCLKSSGKVKGYSDETMTLCFCVLLQFILIKINNKVNNANNLSPSYLYVLHGSDLMSFADKVLFQECCCGLF